MPKLNYKITGPRQVTNDPFSLDYYDIEWTHETGFPPSTLLIPEGHPPNITYREVESESRVVIYDQVTVKQGAPKSIVMEKCEEKRTSLAAALGIEP